MYPTATISPGPENAHIFRHTLRWLTGIDAYTSGSDGVRAAWRQPSSAGGRKFAGSASDFIGCSTVSKGMRAGSATANYYARQPQMFSISKNIVFYRPKIDHFEQDYPVHLRLLGRFVSEPAAATPWVSEPSYCAQVRTT
jgi:hypothetical protein